MSKLIKLEKQIINNSIKPMGGKLPQTFNKIDKLPYMFSKPKKLENDLFEVTIDLVNVNGFYYPANIFTGEIKTNSKTYLYLKPKYVHYGITDYLECDCKKKKFEDMVITKTYYIDINNMIFIDKDFVDTDKQNSKD